MVHTVYETTNEINGKYYIGVHKTEDPQDGYLGSGTLVRKAIAKYGAESFTKRVLFQFDTAEEAFKKEEELIEQHRKDPKCYNLRKGGSGGFDYINRSGLNGTYFIDEQAKKKRTETKLANPATLAKLRVQINEIRKLVSPEVRQASRVLAVKAWAGKKHTPENREKFSRTRVGSGNSQYGTKWMMKDGVSSKVLEKECAELLHQGWVYGRKVKRKPKRAP